MHSLQGQPERKVGGKLGVRLGEDKAPKLQTKFKVSMIRFQGQEQGFKHEVTG